ncbi:MAG TPA: type II secretion system protein [Thermoleophilia bacterium]
MHLNTRQDGFSLIEAVIAVAILGAACVAVSTVLITTLHAERVLEQRRHVEAVLAAESERLAALTYYRRAEDSLQPVSPASLVGDVFPHASPACNTPEAFYTDGSGTGDAGWFISQISVDGLAVRRSARFVTLSPSGLTPVSPGALSDWAVWSDVLPPTGVLEVELQVSSGGHVVGRHAILSALPLSVGAPVAGREVHGHVG